MIPVVSAGTGGITVNASNAAQLDAQALVASATSGGGAQSSYGLVLAFNSLGYNPELFLFNSFDALLGSNYLSDPDPSNATAYIHDTTITHDGGDLDVLATSEEQINATNSNAAITTASALFDATGAAYGGSLASNKVDGSAYAYIDEVRSQQRRLYVYDRRLAFGGCQRYRRHFLQRQTGFVIDGHE